MRIKRVLTLATAVVCISSAMSLGAFWNRKDREQAPGAAPSPAGTVTQAQPGAAATAVRRAHFYVQDDATAQILVQLAESRSFREEEIRVIARLFKEKEAELERMDQRLLERFGVTAEGNYQYDRDSRTLFELTEKQGVDQTAASGAVSADELFDKHTHRTFIEDQEEIEFVRLASAKKITASELQVLALLSKEKQIELTRVQDSLRERFSVSPEKHYEYDADTRTLFEIVRAVIETTTVPGTNPEP